MVPVPSTRRVRVRLLAIAAAVCLAAGGPAAASPETGNPVTATQVKAAFLFNFVKFVQWPAESRPIVIGVVGDQALAVAVAHLTAGRTVDGRSVEVRTFPIGHTPEGYHVVHVSSLLSDDDAAVLLARVRGAVLTIGETPRFLRDGGMVRIFIDDQRLRFQVNRGRADQAGVKISAQALSLAAR